MLGDFRGRLWSKDVNQHLQTTFLLLKFDPLLFPSVGIWPNLGYFNKYAKENCYLSCKSYFVFRDLVYIFFHFLAIAFFA